MRFTEPAFLNYLLTQRRFPEPILEVGAGWTPEYHLEPFRAQGYKAFLTQDVAAYPSQPPASFVCDVCDLTPVESGAIGTVLCFNVLEHCRAPWLAVKAIRRVLEPGGIVVGSVPMRTAIHRHNRDYWRFCPDGIAELFRDFRLDKFVIEGNPDSPANLLFAAVSDPSGADWLEHNETMTASPLIITETDYLTENPLKKAVVRIVRRFGYDIGLWSHHDDVPRMHALGYQQWQLVPQATNWPPEDDKGPAQSETITLSK